MLCLAYRLGEIRAENDLLIDGFLRPHFMRWFPRSLKKSQPSAALCPRLCLTYRLGEILAEYDLPKSGIPGPHFITPDTTPCCPLRRSIKQKLGWTPASQAIL
jgi:hypothetical protein